MRLQRQFSQIQFCPPCVTSGFLQLFSTIQVYHIVGQMSLSVFGEIFVADCFVVWYNYFVRYRVLMVVGVLGIECTAILLHCG